MTIEKITSKQFSEYVANGYTIYVVRIPDWNGEEYVYTVKVVE